MQIASCRRVHAPWLPIVAPPVPQEKSVVAHFAAVRTYPAARNLDLERTEPFALWDCSSRLRLVGLQSHPPELDRLAWIQPAEHPYVLPLPFGFSCPGHCSRCCPADWAVVPHAVLPPAVKEAFCLSRWISPRQ